MKEDLAAWFKKSAHRFRHRELSLLLDVNSGAVHLLDALAWEAMALLESTGSKERAREILEGKYAAEEVAALFAEIAAGEEEGLLFSPEAEAKIEELLPSLTTPKSLCLYLTYDCNLRCAYCFAQGGKKKGKMPLEVGKRALDFLFAQDSPAPGCELDFFGGEPLLNWEVIPPLVSYAREKARAKNKKLTLTLTTNGLLLDAEKEAFLVREGIQLVLSLDGRPEVNDRLRLFPNGQGSFAAVFPRVRGFASRHPRHWWYVRGTFTRHNLDFAQDFAYLAANGLRRISLEPVVAPPDAPYALREEDLPRLLAEYEALLAVLLRFREQGEEAEFFHFNLDFFHGPCLAKSVASCGAGGAYLAVSPEGKLYPCHQLVGEEEYLLGDVWEGITFPERAREFATAHIYRKEACRDCWARFFCSGGCHVQALRRHGDLLKPDEFTCALQKKRIELALYLKVKSLLEEEKNCAGKS